MGIIKILFILFSILIVYKTVIKTLLTYIQFKRRYGELVVIKFFPILGVIGFFKSSFRKYGDTYYIFQAIQRENPKSKGILFLSGISYSFFLIDNEWIKKFNQDQAKFIKQQSRFGSQYLILDGLANVEGNKWKYQRNFVNSSFHYNAILKRVPMMKEIIQSDFEDGIKGLEEFQKIDIVLQSQKVISEIVVKSFFGQSFKQFTVNGKPFAVELTDLMGDIIVYQANIFFLLKSIFLGAEKATDMLNSKKEKEMMRRINDLTNIANQVIDSRLNELSKVKNPQDLEVENFLDLYLKQYLIQTQDPKLYDSMNEDEKITKRLILHQFYSFVFAGTDTTSSLVSNALYELSKNPDCLSKIKDELKQNNVSFENMQVNSLSKLNYLNNFIQETLRFHPVIQLLKPRKAIEDYSNGDLFIPKNAVVNIRLVSQNVTKPILKDINSFKPERFQDSSSIDTYDFIPFSSGARNCIGQHMALLEAKLLMMYIIEKYDIRPVDNYKLRNRSPGVFTPVDQFMIMIKKKQ